MGLMFSLHSLPLVDSRWSRNGGGRRGERRSQVPRPDRNGSWVGSLAGGVCGVIGFSPHLSF